MVDRRQRSTGVVTLKATAVPRSGGFLLTGEQKIPLHERDVGTQRS
jgi:hypothetical protein